jgi:hypothetical protein
MPDPVVSPFSPVDFCALEGTGDDELGSCESPDPPTQWDVRLSSDDAAPNDVSEGAAALTAKFRPLAPAFVAASPSDAGVPEVPRSGRSASAARPEDPDDQFGLAVGIPRFQWEATVGAVKVKGEVDFLQANAHLGSQNDDGSQGENIGAMATGVGTEVTAEYSGWSLTAGVSASMGASISSGEGRDLDNDGKEERCFTVSFGPFTLGECDEL